MEKRPYCIFALFLFLVLVPHTAQAAPTVNMSTPTTSVSCLHTSFRAGDAGTNCTASVSDGDSPTCSITLSSSGSGLVSSPSAGCADITKGACTFTLTNSVAESLIIIATYSGDINEAVGSAVAAQVTVDPSLTTIVSTIHTAINAIKSSTAAISSLGALLPWIGEGLSVVIAIAIAIAYPGRRKKKKQ